MGQELLLARGAGAADPTAQGLTDAYGVDFERTVIWLLLFDQSCSDVLFNTLNSTAFSTDAHAVIYDTAARLFSQLSAPPGYVSVVAELVRTMHGLPDNSPAKLHHRTALLVCSGLQSMAHPGAGTVKYAKDELARFATKARVRQALLQSVDLWEQNDFDGVLHTIEGAVHTTERTLSMDLGVDFNKPAEKIRTYLDVQTSTHHAPTGLPKLDTKLRGGLEPGMLGLVIAPSKRGKSLFLVHVGAAALAVGLDVAVASCELRQNDYAMRFDARLSGVPINEIARAPKQYARRIAIASLGLKGQLRIKHWGANQATVGDLVVWLRALKSRQGFEPDVIIVDYADLLLPEGKRIKERHFGELGDIIRALRQVAGDFNAAVWTAGQTVRRSYNASLLDLNDIALDIQQVHVADVIVGLCQTPAERVSQKMRVALLGNRQGGGEGAVVTCRVTTETMFLVQEILQQQAVPLAKGLVK